MPLASRASAHVQRAANASATVEKDYGDFESGTGATWAHSPVALPSSNETWRPPGLIAQGFPLITMAASPGRGPDALTSTE